MFPSKNSKTNEKTINEIIEEYNHIANFDNYDYEYDLIDIVRMEIVIIKNDFSRKETPMNKITFEKNKNKKSKFGGSYVELPNFLNVLHALLNIKNNDEMCFIWCVLAHLFPATENATRVTKYKEYFKELKTETSSFPMQVDDIDVFAEANKLNIKVWELKLPLFYTSKKSLEEEDIKLLCICESEFNDKKDDIINLLLFKGHYVLIKNFNNLVKWVCNVQYGVIVCKFCMSCHFRSLNAYKNHLKTCIMKDGNYKFDLPKQNEIKFCKFKNQFKSVYCIYADFESILIPTLELFGNNSEKINTHTPISIGIALKKSYSEKIHEEYFYGLNCIEQFINYIDILSRNVRSEMTLLFSKTKQSKQNIENNECFFCKGKFEIDKMYFSIENEVIFNNLSFSSHQKCYISALETLFSIKIFFHNLKGYDSHFIIDAFASIASRFSVIPISCEKYISFQGSINGCIIKFLDSLAFVNGSLASNASKLQKFNYIGSDKDKSNHDLSYLSKYKEKQAFPYEYITSVDILENEKLPKDVGKWFSKLSGKSPKLEEIDFALQTFDELQMQSIKDYMLFYLRIDVLLLLEVYESFRDLALNEYGLDPSHYYTTPGMAWDAALKFTKQKLDLLKNESFINFFCEPGTIRGGISTVSEKKWAESGDNSSIFYYDVTNLYGYAMTFPLPTGNFKLIYEYNSLTNSITKDDIFNILKSWTIDSEFGYIFEVDINIPIELHDKYNELPFLPEKYNDRLIPTLFDKTNYKTYILNLKQAIDHGLILSHVHKVIEFTQSKWLKGYIEHNTQMRSKTKDENMRNFYKLMNNAVYGKTM